LDAVELTKRCAWRSYLEKQPGFEPIERDKEFRFPSTHSIASASFKDAILTRLDKQDSKSLRKALEAWVNKVYPISQGNRSDRKVIPYLTAKANLSAQPLDLLNHFLSLDGRLLFEETYQNPDEFHGADRGQIEIARKALKDFLKVASQNYKIPKPRNYFAVLMMDGDSMGQWLSGDKMPNYEKVLHPNTHKALEQRSDWQQILENRRLMSPAIHGFISKALGDFSLKLVRHIVENRYPGKLVYAGGDDVLALLPVDSVLKVARELRAAFSREIYTGIGTEEEGKPFEVRFGDRYARSGYVSLQITGEDKPRLLPTMGCQATASTGIAIAHRLSPLDLTLQEVRKAEKDAKGKEGRNAFSITFLKRSGETMSAGAKWTYRQNCGESNLLPIDTVSVLLEFQRKFAENSISSKFPYILQEEAETLSLLEIQEIQVLYKAEIKRLLLRQQGSKQLSKEVADDLAEKLAILVTRANEEKRVHAKDENKAKPQGKLKTFADILTFTRFLATGEGED
jgi:CRISPR-associated protein Cmr2